MNRMIVALGIGLLGAGFASCDVFLDDHIACKPDCTSRECGDDPRCGESCGSCDPWEECDPFGRCRPIEDGEEPAGGDDGYAGEPDGGMPDGGDESGDPGDPGADDGGDREPDGGDPGGDGDGQEFSCEELDPDCRLPAADQNPQGPDIDGDGWGMCCDCDDADPDTHPYRREVPGDEVDNDCNGLVDEPGGLMVRLTFYPDVWIDVYEIGVYDHPDCTGHRYGVDSDDFPAGFPVEGIRDVDLYACSLPGVVPSGHLSWYRARWACEAQGKRLCSVEEWGVACSGSGTTAYPYGHALEPGRCNDVFAGQGQAAPAGAYQGCLSEIGTRDQSGNLHEWLKTWSDINPDAARAGGYGFEPVICVDKGSYMDCRDGDLEDPVDVDLFEDLHNCFVGAGDITRHPRQETRAWLGTRCCYQKP